MPNDEEKLQAPRLFRRRRDQRPPEPAPAPAPEASSEAADTRVMEQPVPEPAPEPAPAPAAPRRRRPRPKLRRPSVRVPALRVNAYAAAGLAGLVCGLVLVGLTWLALQATDQGSSVGGRVGLPLLVVIFVVGVVVGGLLLRVLGAPSPGTTAFLGTGAVAVIAMFGIGTHLDTTWAAGLVVVISVAAYLVARWFAARFIEA
jgi:hypothetical protein